MDGWEDEQAVGVDEWQDEQPEPDLPAGWGNVMAEISGRAEQHWTPSEAAAFDSQLAGRRGAAYDEADPFNPAAYGSDQEQFWAETGLDQAMARIDEAGLQYGQASMSPEGATLEHVEAMHRAASDFSMQEADVDGTRNRYQQSTDFTPPADLAQTKARLADQLDTTLTALREDPIAAGVGTQEDMVARGYVQEYKRLTGQESGEWDQTRRLTPDQEAEMRRLQQQEWDQVDQEAQRPEVQAALEAQAAERDAPQREAEERLQASRERAEAQMQQPFDERESRYEQRARAAEEGKQRVRQAQDAEYSSLVGDQSMQHPDAGNLTEEQRAALSLIHGARQAMERLEKIDQSPSWLRPPDYDPAQYEEAKANYLRLRENAKQQLNLEPDEPEPDLSASSAGLRDDDNVLSAGAQDATGAFDPLRGGFEGDDTSAYHGIAAPRDDDNALRSGAQDDASGYTFAAQQGEGGDDLGGQTEGQDEGSAYSTILGPTPSRREAAAPQPRSADEDAAMGYVSYVQGEGDGTEGQAEEQAPTAQDAGSNYSFIAGSRSGQPGGNG